MLLTSVCWQKFAGPRGLPRKKVRLPLTCCNAWACGFPPWASVSSSVRGGQLCRAAQMRWWRNRSSANHLFSPFCLWAAKGSRQKSHHHADWRQHRLISFNLSWILNAAKQPLQWSPNSFPYHPTAAVPPEPPSPPVPLGQAGDLDPAQQRKQRALWDTGFCPCPPPSSVVICQPLLTSKASCPLPVSSWASPPFFSFV